MSVALIVFSLSGYKFAIELEKFPMILIPKEYSGSKKSSKAKKNSINENEINIINMNEYLGVSESQMDSESRLLVGVFNDKTLGYNVDKVLEILNVEEEDLQSTLDYEGVYIKSKLPLKEGIITVLDSNKIINEELSGSYDAQ